MKNYLPLMIFGAFALLTLAYLQGMRLRRGGQINTNFVVIYGLVTISTLGGTIAFAAVDESARTAVFTLLGTVAGYLAGRTVPDQGAKKSAAARTPAAADTDPA